MIPRGTILSSHNNTIYDIVVEPFEDKSEIVHLMDPEPVSPDPKPILVDPEPVPMDPEPAVLISMDPEPIPADSELSMNPQPQHDGDIFEQLIQWLQSSFEIPLPMDPESGPLNPEPNTRRFRTLNESSTSTRW